ncbi:MAG: hypothetical protein V8T86_15725 [Victivallis sp.]
MAQWLLLLGIAMFLVLLMFIVLLMLSVSRRVLRSGEYHNPPMPDARSGSAADAECDRRMETHVGKPRRDTTTRPVPKVGQPADSPNFSVPPRQAAAPSPAGRSAPPPVILNEAAREVAETGINIDVARTYSDRVQPHPQHRRIFPPSCGRSSSASAWTGRS